MRSKKRVAPYGNTNSPLYTAISMNLVSGTDLRTNAFLGGRSTDVKDAIKEAMESMKDEWELI